MDDTQRYTLEWLTGALTTPISYTDYEYYYEAVTKLFFSRIRLDSFSIDYVIRDSFGRLVDVEISSDLLVRLELLNDQSSEIVEIPKLNINDKVAIQTLFLKHFEGVQFYSELLEAVSKQQDDFGFVLDTVVG